METETVNRRRRPLLRVAAAISLLWESFWPRAIPLAMVAEIFLSLSWFGLWTLVAPPLRFAILAGLAILAVTSLWPLRMLRLPSRHQITRRIEQASRLQHRPLTAQEDRMAMGQADGFAAALWREHNHRMAAGIDGLTAGTPAPKADRRDPWALRAAIAVIAFVALGYSFGPGGGRIADAFTARHDPAALLARTDAWINPPPYTRKPPIYLSGLKYRDDSEPVTAPQGSQFVLRHTGKDAVETAFIGPQGEIPIAAKDAATETSTDRQSAQTEFVHALDQSGAIELRSRGRAVAQWRIDVIADEPPQIRFTQPPSAALSGSLQLAYEVEDDYGVTGAEVDIKTLVETEPGARPLVGAPEAALPLPRQRAKSGTAKANRDLTEHPWANSRVRMRLIARDDAGQTGSSPPVDMILPGRNFSNPLALALIEQRRNLALDARSQPRVAGFLDAIATAAEDFVDNAPTIIGLHVAYRRVQSARGDDDLRAALPFLWEMALAIEFGDLTDAERRLRDAQEALSKALEDGAGDEEIARLTEELRKAMEEFMEALRREALQNPLAQNPSFDNEFSRTLRERDLQRMLDQIENLARSGSRDAARQMLSELQRMMDNLRAGRHMQQRQAEGNRMNQALDRLSELMRQQQELMEETFRLDQQSQRQQPMRPGGRNPPQSQDGEQQNGEADREALEKSLREALEQLRQRQQQLQQDLGELGQELEALGLDPSEQFGEAGREMGEAGENLSRGQPGEASGDQGQALDALRRGAQSMMQQMAGDRQQGGQQPGDGRQGGMDRQRTDPLGRRTGSDGLENGEDTEVPNEIEAQRAREILEAIRKRLSQPYSPRIEKDYLERLLETR